MNVFNDYSKLEVIGDLPKIVICSAQFEQLKNAVTGVTVTSYNVGRVLAEAHKKVVS